MYAQPPRRGGLAGATGVLVNGGGSSNPCDDTLWRMTHAEQCASLSQPITSGPTTSPPPPTYLPPPDAQPYPVATVQTYDTEAGPGTGLPAVQPIEVASAPSSFWLDFAGGGGNGGAPVTVDVTTPDAPGRGFGMVEAGVAAGLAILLAAAWQRRGRK